MHCNLSLPTSHPSFYAVRGQIFTGHAHNLPCIFELFFKILTPPLESTSLSDSATPISKAIISRSNDVFSHALFYLLTYLLCSIFIFLLISCWIHTVLMIKSSPLPSSFLNKISALSLTTSLRNLSVPRSILPSGGPLAASEVSGTLGTCCWSTSGVDRRPVRRRPWPRPGPHGSAGCICIMNRSVIVEERNRRRIGVAELTWSLQLRRSNITTTTHSIQCK